MLAETEAYCEGPRSGTASRIANIEIVRGPVIVVFGHNLLGIASSPDTWLAKVLEWPGYL